MQPFTLVQVNDTRAAIDAVAGDRNAKFIAGGTNLLDLAKMNVETPGKLVDINSLELDKIESLPNGTVRIGAMVRNSDLAYHPTVIKQFPALSQALLSGASAQLRNMATLGGNLLQRTRCQYFFHNTFPCNKRVPGSGCSAINGFNRIHAILGTSDKCIATHPSDMAVALTALDAIVHLQGPRGERSVPIGAFHLVPGDTPEKETVLEHGDLVTGVDLPAIPFAAKSHYLKVRDRASFAFALVSAAVAVEVSKGKITAARLALGGVGTKPWRAGEAEKMLVGAPASEKSYQSAANAIMKDAVPRKHNAFKIELAKRTVVRALTIAGGNV